MKIIRLSRQKRMGYLFLAVTIVAAFLMLPAVAAPAPDDGNVYQANDPAIFNASSVDEYGFVGILRGMAALDGQTAWAVGGAEYWGAAWWIVGTTDGGRNWTFQGRGPDGYLQDVTAPGSGAAWAGGLFGALVKTADGGRNWEQESLAGFGMVNGIEAVDQATIWAAGFRQVSGGYEGVIARTDDAGVTWQEQKAVGVQLQDIAAVDAQTAWAVGNGIVLATTDGGSNWTEQDIATSSRINAVSAVDAQTAWAADASYQIFRTVDGGENWDLVQSGPEASGTSGSGAYAAGDYSAQQEGPPQGFISISAADAENAWATGPAGLIVNTKDGGATWENQVSGTTQWLYDVDAVDAQTAWAVGDNMILRTGDGGATWTRQGISRPPADTWYLAEGSTGGTFETWVLVQNPGNTDAKVTLTFHTPGGEQPGPQAVLPARTRQTFNLGAIIPDEYSVSTTVSADVPVVAERAMYWDNRTGGHDSLGVNVPSDTWYLAEGSTGGTFETWVLVQNPGNTDAKVTLTFQTPGGEQPGPQAVLPARTRQTFNLGEVLPGVDSISTTVSADVPVVAERAMYWDNRTGGHDSLGVNVPAFNWYLAEGSTGGTFETWVLVQNPGDTDANVNLTFQTPGGEQPGPQAVLPPGTRQTFNLGDILPGVDSISTTVSADVPVVAERAMYWGYRTGGHDSIGNVPADTWYLAEGSTGGTFETWVLVQNPGDTDANVTLTFQTPEGEQPGPQAVLPPGTRQTFNLGDILPGVDSISTTVSADVPVVAERAMYWGDRTGGHDSIGAGFNR